MAKIAKTLGVTQQIAFWSVLFVLGFVTSTVLGGNIPSDLRETHLLNRLAFGPRPGDLERVKSKGVDRYIEEQLSPTSIPLPEVLITKLNSLETLCQGSLELFNEYGPPSYAGKKGEAAQMARQRARVILDQAANASLLTAVESPRQLLEVMVNFWFNHFNIFSKKGLEHL